jgi:hypothetical protein
MSRLVSDIPVSLLYMYWNYAFSLSKKLGALNEGGVILDLRSEKRDRNICNRKNIPISNTK